MKAIIFTKQFFWGLFSTAVVVFLLAIAPAPQAASLPPGEALTQAQLRQVFRADDLVDPLRAEMERELAEMPRYDEPDQAQEFYAQQRVPPGETAIPLEKYELALQQMEQMPQYATATGQFLPSRRAMKEQGLEAQAIGAWEPLGPGNVGGRTRALLIDPANPNIMYAAGVSGGVWKSTNAGGSWTPLGDLLPNLAFSAMAMDPSNSNVIYAGTGEGYFNIDAVRGNGIFKTTNGGASWTHLTETVNDSDFFFVNDIVVSANDAQRVYAATQTGVWRSLNGGTTWTQVLNTAGVNGCTDLVIRSDVGPADTVLAACGTFAQGTIHRTENSGDSWPTTFSEADMGRTSLAIAPANQEVMYALASSRVGGPGGNYLHGLYKVFRSDNGGDSWNTQVQNNDVTVVNTLLLTNPFFQQCVGPFFNQGWYDNVIAVDPLNPDIVWTGGIDLFRSDDGGQNWGLASHWWADPPNTLITAPQYAHADQHVLVFHPNYNGASNQTMFVGNDGGIFRTDNARAATTTNICALIPDSSVTWTNLNNGYGVTQFYHGVPYPDGQTYLGGTQDNGTNRGGDAAGANAWAEIQSGDGGYVAVDPTNPNVIFAEFTRLSLQKSTNGGVTFNGATSGIAESSNNFLFINPFIMDPSNPQILWTGGFFLWRTTNQANNWVQASAITPGGGSVSAWAVAPTDSNYVLAAMSDGFILRNQNALSTNSGTNWPNTRPATGFVSWLAFDPNDKNIAYATYSSFDVDHVWKSTNAGQTWTAIDHRDQPNGIPNIPAHSVIVDPADSNRIFVGTDLGVFVTTDGGANWAVENSGFANTVVEAFYINRVNNVDTLFAFTHGRGAYRVNLPANQVQLALTKAAPATVVSGRTLTYTLTASNAGGIDATNVVMTDTVPASTTLVLGSLSGDATASAAAAGSLITWTTGTTLTLGQDLSRSFVVTVDDNLEAGTQIVNTAYVSATNEATIKSNTVTTTVQVPTSTIYLPSLLKD